MRIAVVGLGKIGLPLAVQFASKGHAVYGVDINPHTVETVNAGREPFPGEAHLADYLEHFVSAGNLRATTDFGVAIPNSEYVVVVVPLFVDNAGRPDFGWLDNATTDIAKHLTAGTTVIYETTLPVGTTRNRWAPHLEEISGFREGKDFHVVFSPERVLTGRVFEDLKRYPKLIGGLSLDGAGSAARFYNNVLDFDTRLDLEKPNGVWDLGSAEAAELAKLAETTYRDVNIGLANHFAKFAARSNIDVYQVIQACNSQPYSHIHHPGIAVGGHCIPVYPQLYLSTDPDATIVRAARRVNDEMPKYAIDQAEALTGSLAGKRAVVLGAAYRGGVKETAFSGVFPLVNELRRRQGRVFVHDPLYDGAELATLGFEAFSYGQSADVAFLQADHEEYRQLSAQDIPDLQVLIDGRGIVNPARFPAAVVNRIGVGR